MRIAHLDEACQVEWQRSPLRNKQSFINCLWKSAMQLAIISAKLCLASKVRLSVNKVGTTNVQVTACIYCYSSSSYFMCTNFEAAPIAEGLLQLV